MLRGVVAVDPPDDVEVPPCGVLQDVPLEIVPGPVYVVAVEVYVEDAMDVSLLGVLVEVP